jgi:hypothetical protein
VDEATKKIAELAVELNVALHSWIDTGDDQPTISSAFWTAGKLAGAALELAAVVDRQADRVAQLEHELMLAVQHRDCRVLEKAKT